MRALSILCALSLACIGFAQSGDEPGPEQAFGKYPIGTEFYYPKSLDVFFDERVLDGYARYEDKQDKRLKYKAIQGQQFTLEKIIHPTRSGEKSFLQLKSNSTEVVIRFYYDREAYSDSIKSEYANLPFAIAAKELSCTKNLTRELYAKFAIKGKKFQKVSIDSIGFGGSSDAPVRIYYSFERKPYYKDVVLCGINVPPASRKQYAFSEFFDTTDPLAQVDDNAKRLAMSKGIALVGMTAKEIILMKGKPKKSVSKTVVIKGALCEITEMTYPDTTYILTDGKLQ